MEEGNLPEYYKTGKNWSTDPLQVKEIPVGKEGLAALPPTTAVQNLKQTVAKFPNKLALAVKRDGKWVEWTWQKYYDEIMLCARAILSFNVGRREAINIIGFNSPEWFIADLAGICAGAIVAPNYTTNGPDAVQYIVDHSQGVVAFVENEVQLKKFLQIRDKCTSLKAIVQWGGTVPEEKDVYSWSAFLELGKKVEQSELEKRMEELKPSQCATVIYTSGTTGPPKAVMLSHDNITWTSQSAAKVMGVGSDDVVVSYLPLSHIAAQLVDIHLGVTFGCTVYFAQPDALKGTLVNTLKEAKPTIFLGVPRVWEKMEERMREIGKQTTGLKLTIATWAKGVGKAAGYAQMNHQSGPWNYFIADALVFSKIRAALGLERARILATAAAPISKDTLEYFLSIGMPIFEIYGMSECTGPQTLSTPTSFRIGYTGKSIPGTELKLDRPDAGGNGEICYRGRHIFMGYMKDPKATAETIDDDGWLHSGDIGALTQEGFLAITGRIKELIITAGGENIPPVLIEDEIKKEIGSVISQVMVVGDRKKFLSCVVTLRCKPLANPQPGEYPFTNELVDSIATIVGDASIKTVEDAIKSEKVKQYIHAGISKANSRSASNAQKVQKFIIVPKDFTLETGELTPTLKLKRRIVVQQYTDQIEQMYAEATD